MTGLRYSHGQWSLQGDRAVMSADTAFEAVLLTPPAPQTREILTASALGGVDGGQLDAALADARYHQQLWFALGFGQALEGRPDCFALINSDRAHDIAWLSFENDKPGRDLGGSTVMMVQMFRLERASLRDGIGAPGARCSGKRPVPVGYRPPFPRLV